MQTSENHSITVALADDHVVFRQGFSGILSSVGSFSVVLEAASGDELLERLAQAPAMPDICIIDISMHGMTGFETVAAIREKWPQLKTVLLSMFSDEANIANGIQNGARAFLSKQMHPTDIVTALNHVHKNGYYYTEEWINYRMTAAHKDVIKITSKERQFLQLVCSNRTMDEIAREMKTTIRSIDGYKDALYQKLNVHNRTSLALYALKMGYAQL